MAVQEVRVVFNVDDKELTTAKEKTALLKKEFDLAGQAIDRDKKKLADLKAELSKATDPKQVLRLNSAILATEKSLLGAQKQAVGLRNQLNEVGKTETPLQRVSGAIQKMGMNVPALGAAIAAGFAVKAIANFAVEGVKLAGVMEQNRIAFTTFLGSAQMADKVLNDLAKFGAETPFEFPELVDAAKKLIAFGVSTDDLMNTLRRLGDIAAGTGKPIEELSSIYGKMLAKGKAGTEELNMLVDAGVPIMAELRNVTGLSKDELTKFIETGKLGFPIVQQALDNLTNAGGKFAGLTKAQSETMNGLLSTLNDNWNEMKRTLGEALLPVMKELITASIQFLSDAKSAFIGAQSVIMPYVEALSAVKTGWDASTKAIGNYFGISTRLAETTAVLKTIGTEVIDGVASPWQKALEYATKYFAAVGRQVEAEPAVKGQERLNTALTALQQNFKLTDAEGQKFLNTIKDYSPVGKTTEQIMKDLAFLYRDMGNASKEGEVGVAITLDSMRANLKKLKEDLEKTEVGSVEFTKLVGEIKTLDKEISKIEDTFKNVKEKTDEFVKGSLAFLRAELSAVKKTIDETPSDSGLIPGMLTQAKALEAQIAMIENQYANLGKKQIQMNAIAPIPVEMELLPPGETKKPQVPIIVPVKPEMSEEDKQALLNGAIELTQMVADTIFQLQQEALQRQKEADLAVLDEQYQADLKMAGGNIAAKTKAEKKYAAEKLKIEKEAFEKQKKMAIAMALINGALAVTRILADVPKGDFGIATAILIGLAIATTASEVAIIASQSFAKGGIDIQGAGTETSDSIPANLSRGESVMTAKETKQWKPLFKAIRRGDVIPGQAGLPVLKHDQVMQGLYAMNASLDDKRIVSELKRQTKALKDVLADSNVSRPNYQSTFSRNY